MISLVGTWGTVLFPLAWQSFISWWQFRESIPAYSPLINDDIITNKFYLDNPQIWSPWMIKLVHYSLTLTTSRFAHECGGKWLYPNLPGNLTLVSNYRDKGENYKSSLGPSTDLLNEKYMVDFHQGVTFSSGLIAKDGEYSCLWYYPTIGRLSRWQYNLALQRYGLNDGLLYDLSKITSLFPYNRSHLVEMLEIVEATLPLFSNIVFIGDSPILHPVSKLFQGRHIQIGKSCDFPIILCAPLAELMIFQSLRPKLVHGLIVDMDYLKKEKINIQRVWDWFHDIQIRYLFLTGPYCIEAPTDIVVSSRDLACEGGSVCKNNSRSLNYYTIVEDICLEIGNGMTVYRNMNTLPADWLIYRHGIAKRIGNGLVGRRFIRKEIKNSG